MKLMLRKIRFEKKLREKTWIKNTKWRIQGEDSGDLAESKSQMLRSLLERSLIRPLKIYITH